MAVCDGRIGKLFYFASAENIMFILEISLQFQCASTTVMSHFLLEFVGLIKSGSCLFYQRAAAAAAELSVLSCSKEVLDRLAQLGCKPSEGFFEFLHCLLESFPSSPAQQKTPVNHLWVKEGLNSAGLSVSVSLSVSLSLSQPFLSHTSLCLRPWRKSNSILACRPHPSCLYQWLMFYFATLAKKIPFIWWGLPLR